LGDASSAGIRVSDIPAVHAVSAVREYMGKVALTYRLMPSETDVDYESVISKLRSSLPESAQLREHRIVPIAFGLKALEIMIICEDTEGVAEKVENSLSSLPGIESVTPTGTTLL
jgi:elongation factor 1-beta